MFDCAVDVLGYHDDEVTLPDAERKTMRERRNTNRQRLDAGLIRDEKPGVLENKAQGSYAMRTMRRIWVASPDFLRSSSNQFVTSQASDLFHSEPDANSL